MTSNRLPFWFEDDCLGATPAEIDAAERHIGFPLPAGLRELLLEKDGGVSNYAAYVRNGEEYPLLPFLGGSPHRGESLMLAADSCASSGIPAGIVPFALDGHSWWGLDYRTNPGEPTIVFSEDEEHDCELVARSFSEFLKGLIQG